MCGGRCITPEYCKAAGIGNYSIFIATGKTNRTTGATAPALTRDEREPETTQDDNHIADDLDRDTNRILVFERQKEQGIEAMTDILIERKHSLPIEDLIRKLRPAVEKKAQEYNLRLQWSDRICEFFGPAQGRLKIENSSLVFAARLGPLAKLIHQEIEREINRVIDSVIG